MEITIFEAREVYSALGSLKGQDLVGRVSIQISKLANVIEPIYNRSETTKTDVAKKHGKPDETNPNVINFTKDGLDAFNKEWEEVLSLKEEIGNYNLKEEDFLDVKVPFTFFAAMKPLFVQELVEQK